MLFSLELKINHEHMEVDPCHKEVGESPLEITTTTSECLEGRRRRERESPSQNTTTTFCKRKIPVITLFEVDIVV